MLEATLVVSFGGNDSDPSEPVTFMAKDGDGPIACYRQKADHWASVFSYAAKIYQCPPQNPLTSFLDRAEASSSASDVVIPVDILKSVSMSSSARKTETCKS